MSRHDSVAGSLLLAFLAFQGSPACSPSTQKISPARVARSAPPKAVPDAVDIDSERIHALAAPAGVVVKGEAGAVPGDARVRVTNTTRGENAVTKANSLGFFLLGVEGKQDDEYQVTVEVGGKTTTQPLPIGLSENDPILRVMNRDFVLKSATGYEPLPQLPPRISFGFADFAFSGGCNRHSGAYTLCGDSLCLYEVMSTQRGCPGELQKQDAWLATFFGSKPKLELKGSELTFTGQGAQLTFLDREIAEPNRELTGPTWIVNSFITSFGVINYALDNPPTLTFNQSGHVDIFSGCRKGRAIFSVREQRMQISNLALDDTGCQDENSEQTEQHILELLQSRELLFGIEADRMQIMRNNLAQPDLGIEANAK